MESDLYKVCQENDYSNSFRNYFALNISDSIIVECLTPVAVISAALNIYFFYRFPNAREPPFDILLFITILSLVNQSVYLSTVIYNGVYPPSRTNIQYVPDTFNNFCLITGTLRFSSEVGATVYNTVFCFYYTCKIKNPLKAWVRQNKQIHGLCIIVSALVVVIVYVSNFIGVSVLGVCGLKVAKTSVFIELLIFFLYFFILVVTSVFFLRYLKQVGKHDEKAKTFFKYFLLYTLVIAVIYLLECAVLVLLIVDCYTGLSQQTYEIFAKIGNILILITPPASTIIIAYHPQFRTKLVPETLKLFVRRKKQDQELKDQFYDNLLTTANRKSTQNTYMIELSDLNSQNKGYLSNIKESNRLSLLSTVLGCISLTSYQRRNRHSLLNRSTMGSNQQDHIFTWNFNDQYETQVDEDVVKQHTDHFPEKVPSMKIKFVAHSVSVFQQLMDMDGVDYLQQSTNPNKNLNKIYKNAQADGGSSGQFFFFTHDNRILLKTITEQQFQVLFDRLQSYYHHFRNHEESLIVKIYGVFTAINPETNEKIHFMMMGNLCEDIDKKYVLRIYDCKGSSHQREVFKQNKQQQQHDFTRKTMKDVDFNRLQNKIWVKKQLSDKIKQILKNDSFYFFQNGLIDYSLIVIKIDYNAYRLDLQSKKPTFNNRTMFYNQKQPNMIYVLGIIDYLQTWNVKKKSQRWYKSLFTKSETISSQSPAYYSKRFCENLIQKIFI